MQLWGGSCAMLAQRQRKAETNKVKEIPGNDGDDDGDGAGSTRPVATPSTAQELNRCDPWETSRFQPIVYQTDASTSAAASLPPIPVQLYRRHAVPLT